MPRRHSGKTKCLARHAKRRAWERCGLALTKADLSDIVRQIRLQSERAIFVRRYSNRVSLWLVSINVPDEKPTHHRVLYDKQRHQIVTFLPPGEDRKKKALL
ncbi:MAG: hypothetical protein V1846_04045 [Candidatus Komeilibacteria bacterium]